MKTISEYKDMRVPTYALSYLVNGDASGLEDNDQTNIDKWFEQFATEAKNCGGQVIFSTPDNGEPYFSHCPEFGLACDVEDCTVLICK